MSKPKEQEQEQLNPQEPEKTPEKNEPSEAEEQQDDGESLTPKQQAALDARIKREIAKVRANHEAEMAAEKERLAKEAREAQLLEKENFKELYEQTKTEADALKKQAENAMLDSKTDTLLNNAEITNPELRQIIKELPPDLEARAARIEELRKSIDAEAENRVSKRMHTPPPDKKGTVSGKKIADMTDEEKNDYRKRIGDEAFVAKVREETSVSK